MTKNTEPRVQRSRFATVVARLTSVNVLIILFAFITSPILARALGPSGRGEVAAIFAVIGVAPWIGELGMTAFLSREHARRSHPLGVLIGSTMPLTIGGSLVGVALAIPLAHLFGRGRPVVVEFIELGLFLLPFAVFAQTLYGVAVADQKWGVVMLSRILTTGGVAATIVALRLANDLTVETAAVTYVAWGILSNLPYLVELRGSRPWRFEFHLARTGLMFGMKSWLSTVASTGNAQLDQVLMAGLVSSRQLGLYSLAVTLATACSSLISATTNALFARVASGDVGLAARACRVTVMLIIVFGLAVGAVSPVFVPIVFGRAFSDMTPMLLILLAANVFTVPAQVLGFALIAGGNPSATAWGQTMGLIVTVPALVVVLPFAGGIGAAWVSFGAYAITFAIILAAAGRTFSISYWEMLVVTPHDLGWLWRQMPTKRSVVA